MSDYIFTEPVYNIICLQGQVYDICLKTCDDGMDGTDVFPENPKLIGDRYE